MVPLRFDDPNRIVLRHLLTVQSGLQHSDFSLTLQIVNATRLMELLILEPGPSNRSRNDKDDKQLPGTCVLVLFYARWCIFSSQAAPHFNAIPRSFPPVKAVAIDAIKHQR